MDKPTRDKPALTRELTILHVSDFHIKEGDPYDRDTVLSALVEAVRWRREQLGRSVQGRQPDLIFATGDIAHSGKPGEYARASLFFDSLLAAAGLSKDRLFVIPGNHDVDRDVGEDLKRTLKSDQDSVRYFAPGRSKPHFDKLAAYRKWHDEYFERVPDHLPAPNGTTCQAIGPFIINGVKTSVLIVNSALFCQGDDDQGKLWIGLRCLDDARSAPALAPGAADLCIALMHHPFDWLHEAEEENIRAELRSTADLILRGHLHKSDVEAVTGVSGSSLHLAAGAAYQGSNWPNRALYVTVDYSAGQVRVLPLRYEGTPLREWTVDPALFPRADGQEGRFPVTWKAPHELNTKPYVGPLSDPTTTVGLNSVGIRASSEADRSTLARETISQTVAMVFVDVMRLLYTDTGRLARTANADSRSEFVDVAIQHFGDLRSHIGALAGALDAGVHANLVVVENRLSWMLMQLKQGNELPESNQRLFDVAKKLSEQVHEILSSCLGDAYGNDFDHVGRTLRHNLSAYWDTSGGSAADSIFRIRLITQSQLLDEMRQSGGPDLRTIADDMDYAVAITYFLIDYHALHRESES